MGKVGFGAGAEGVDDGAEAVEHDDVFSGLGLEGVEDSVDEAFFETRTDVGSTEGGDEFLDDFGEATFRGERESEINEPAAEGGALDGAGLLV